MMQCRTGYPSVSQANSVPAHLKVTSQCLGARFLCVRVCKVVCDLWVGVWGGLRRVGA